MKSRCMGKREARNINSLGVLITFVSLCPDHLRKIQEEKVSFGPLFQRLQSNIMAGKAQHSS